MHALQKPSLTLASKPATPAPMRTKPTYPALVLSPSASDQATVDNHLTHADFQKFLSAVQVGRVARRQRIVKMLSASQF